MTDGVQRFIVEMALPSERRVLLARRSTSPGGSGPLLPRTKKDMDFEVQAALAWHDDDVNATIAPLLEDIRHLRQQLALAEAR